jgi:hypothetical protein
MVQKRKESSLLSFLLPFSQKKEKAKEGEGEKETESEH